jgi:PHD/YefM family antitoxin component YafN of YafNO toxin-antitoxin module
MYKFIVDENKRKSAVIISIEEYEAIQKELKEYRKKIEIFEEKLDIKLAEKAIKAKGKKIPFNLSNYVL